jgi:hypothetical protein
MLAFLNFLGKPLGRLVHDGKRIWGQGRATGIEYARGHGYNWIWVLDADTRPRRGTLESLIRLRSAVCCRAASNVAPMISEAFQQAIETRTRIRVSRDNSDERVHN